MSDPKKQLEELIKIVKDNLPPPPAETDVIKMDIEKQDDDSKSPPMQIPKES